MAVSYEAQRKCKSLKEFGVKKEEKKVNEQKESS